MKHTPGPWSTPYVDILPVGVKALRIDSTQAEGVAVVALLPLGDDEITAIQHANAALIAAAPELLEALIQIAEKAAQISPGANITRILRFVDEIEGLAHAVVRKAGVDV